MVSGIPTISHALRSILSLIKYFTIAGQKYVVNYFQKTLHIKWIPWHHGMVCQVADGGDGLQIGRIAANY
jgi:hypothetical protein